MPNFKGEQVDPVASPAMNPESQGQGQMNENDPKVQQLIQRGKKYEVVLMNLLHGKQTREDVLAVLKSNPDPYVSVPTAAMTINDMGVAHMKQGGVEVDPAVQMVASSLLLNDLLLLGEGAEAFQLQEGDAEAILEDTYQQYIHRGLKDKSIDPIQLQAEVQKVMTEEQAVGGVMMMPKGMGAQPSRQAMTEQTVQTRVHQEQTKQQGKQIKKEAMQKRDKMTALAQQKMQGGE